MSTLKIIIGFQKLVTAQQYMQLSDGCVLITHRRIGDGRRCVRTALAATVRLTGRPAAAAAAASDAVRLSSQLPSTSTSPDDGRTGNRRHASRRDECVVDVMSIVRLNINTAQQLFVLQNKPGVYGACASAKSLHLQALRVICMLTKRWLSRELERLNNSVLLLRLGSPCWKLSPVFCVGLNQTFILTLV